MFLKCNNNDRINNTKAGVLQVDITDYCPIIISVPTIKYSHFNTTQNTTSDTKKYRF